MRTVISIMLCLFIFQEISYSQSDYLAGIEKEMIKVGNKLYASRYEITNSQYNIFFNYLIENNNMRELEIAWPDTSQWIQAGSEYMPMARVYRWYPIYSSYPACNVSYEAVLLFCNWLTEQYMSYPERIFQNVKFRLPSEYEWMNAAKGGMSTFIYPWGTDSPVSDEGKPFCNFLVDQGEGAENETDEDLNSILAPVKSYFPNGFGLYNISGNVAEMINQRGVAKGGSWRSTGEEIRIDARQRYDGPSPFVGFRIYMDVLDD